MRACLIRSKRHRGFTSNRNAIIATQTSSQSHAYGGLRISRLTVTRDTSALAAAALVGALFTFDAAAECPPIEAGADAIESDVIRAATLNMAHGRKDGRNQMLLGEDTIRSNLVEVAGLMDRSEADVIALQEVDAESRWSGKFNHLDFLSANSAYVCTYHGLHANGWLYDFGTALLARRPFHGSFGHSFQPSWPTTTKGFSLASLGWNPGGTLPDPVGVNFVSVHLDFSRRSVRRSQIDEMVAELSLIEGPMVMMGDFNTDWQTADSSLKYLAEQMNLSVFQPHADGLSTYGDKGARLDWILISEELAFSRYSVIPDVVSDHYAVAAEVVLKDESAGSTDRMTP
jgi:endonuclease/exonuclease/phosphatase family metal-dependent hydrolase